MKKEYLLSGPVPNTIIPANFEESLSDPFIFDMRSTKKNFNIEVNKLNTFTKRVRSYEHKRRPFFTVTTRKN